MNDKLDGAKGTVPWVLAFDKETGERVGSVCCPQGQVAARRMLFEMDGCRVKVMTNSEVDEFIKAEGNNRYFHTAIRC